MHRLTRIMMGVLAFFWLGVGAAALTRIVDLGVPADGRVVLGVLALADGLAFAVLSRFVLRGRRIADVAAGGLLAVNAVLSVTDQMGALDWISLAANAATLVLLAIAVVRLRRTDKDDT